MKNQSSSQLTVDSVQLTKEEANDQFDYYWTDERKHHAKKLAKLLTQTDLDAVEHDEHRAEQHPENHIIVMPTLSNEEKRTRTLPREQPKLHISTGSLVEQHFKIYKLTETPHFPD